ETEIESLPDPVRGTPEDEDRAARWDEEAGRGGCPEDEGQQGRSQATVPSSKDHRREESGIGGFVPQGGVHQPSNDRRDDDEGDCRGVAAGLCGHAKPLVGMSQSSAQKAVLAAVIRSELDAIPAKWRALIVLDRFSRNTKR